MQIPPVLEPYFTSFTVLNGVNVGFTWWSPIAVLGCLWKLYEEDILIDQGLINTDPGDNGHVTAQVATTGNTYYVTLAIAPWPTLETAHLYCE